MMHLCYHTTAMSDEEYILVSTWIEQTQKRWLGWLREINEGIIKMNKTLDRQGETLDRIGKNILKKTDL